MESFRQCKTRVLVSTNLLSRGVDVLTISLVINYDLPVMNIHNEIVVDPETYLHRIGRTGRFKRYGLSVNLITSPEQKKMEEEIQDYFACDIKEVSNIE